MVDHERGVFFDPFKLTHSYLSFKGCTSTDLSARFGETIVLLATQTPKTNAADAINTTMRTTVPTDMTLGFTGSAENSDCFGSSATDDSL